MKYFFGKALFSAAFWALCSLTSQAQTFANPSLPSRIEVHALPTQTLTGEEFLKGASKGQSHLLAAELRIPQGQKAKFPAVVLIHGSGGVSGSMDRWVHALNEAGIATLVVDTFSGRGITSTVQDQTLLHSLAMMVDSYRALDLLGACRTWESSAANQPQRSIFRHFFDQYLDIDLQNRQKLSSRGPIFAFYDPSPTGS